MFNRPGQGRHVVFGIKKPDSTYGDCERIPHESENHINVGPISIRDVKEPLRTTSTLAVTTLLLTLSASTERLALHKCSEKD